MRPPTGAGVPEAGAKPPWMKKKEIKEEVKKPGEKKCRENSLQPKSRASDWEIAPYIFQLSPFLSTSMLSCSLLTFLDPWRP
jgi:hypothetical protein